LTFYEFIKSQISNKFQISNSKQISLQFLTNAAPPIWWYRPAVPLWTFVVKNDFQNQKTILFNTFNSRFKDKHIDEFSDLVKSKGVNLLDHIFIRRGCWFYQLNQKELAEQIQTLIESKETHWDIKRISKMDSELISCGA
jgi:hypothetical protein